MKRIIKRYIKSILNEVIKEEKDKILNEINSLNETIYYAEGYINSEKILNDVVKRIKDKQL